MTSDEIDYEIIKEQPDGAECLFRVMTRLEYALKKIDFLKRPNKKNADKKNAEVDWDRFATERLGAQFFDTVKASGKANVLIHSPPNRQTVRCADDPVWVPTSVSNTQELIGALRRVRNNLFHGGKTNNTDINRNNALVDNALCVINAILQHDRELRKNFERNDS